MAVGPEHGGGWKGECWDYTVNTPSELLNAYIVHFTSPHLTHRPPRWLCAPTSTSPVTTRT